MQDAGCARQDHRRILTTPSGRMHKRIYQEFERICSDRKAGGAVLEVGARASPRGLLAMKCLKQAREKIGINLNPSSRYEDFEIVQGNANDMRMFPDERFDTVLCNAMLEHDKFFWKTVSEIHRVTKRGGLIVIGVPGYVTLPVNRLFRGKRPGIRMVDWLFESTVTYRIHDAPGDYYRFSPQAVEQVLLQRMKDIQIRVTMIPPRIIGSGIKP
jgi:SAM-dependent methyltransferase